MMVILWVVTTAIGWAIGNYGFDSPILGAVIGFIVGLVISVSVRSRSSGGLLDASDIFDIID